MSCATCGDPICPDCMVQAPVGIKCRTCARHAALGARAAEARPRREGRRRGRRGRGLVGGVALASLAATPFGFFGFLIAYGVGRGTGELVLRASGRFRGQATGAIAAAGALGAYLTPIPARAADRTATRSRGSSGWSQVVLGAVAGFFAYRQAA